MTRGKEKGFHSRCLFCPGAAPSDLQDDADPYRGKKEVAIRSYPFGSGPIQHPTPKLCPGKQELTLLSFSTMGPAQPGASFSLFFFRKYMTSSACIKPARDWTLAVSLEAQACILNPKPCPQLPAYLISSLRDSEAVWVSHT